jgi:VWFA-related protein
MRTISLELALMIMAAASVHSQGNNTIRSETKIVLVDAVVTDKKGYVHDLTAKDFEVFEDDKKQAITSFSSETDPGGASKAQTHYMMLLFDDSSMDNSEQRRARDAAIGFVQANAGPDRMIAIVNFHGALQVVQNFTDDAVRLKTVLAGGAPFAPSISGGAPDLTSTASLGAGTLFLAVRSLARNLASAPGRKTLILFSTDSRLRPQEHVAEINAVLDACNRANVAIYGIDTSGFVASPTGFDGRVGVPPGSLRGNPGFGGLDCNPRFTPTGCPQSSADADSSRNQQAGLRMLSAGSGGFVINNTNDLAGGLERIGKEQSEYYLLGYTPPDSPEGSCHRLRVKVDRGGTAVRARAGYCNERSNNALAGSSIEKELESLPISPPGGRNATLEAPFFYTSANFARINLAMEIPLRKLKTEKEHSKMRTTVHVLGIAHRPDGSVAARFSENVGLAFDDEKRLAAFLAAPFHYENQFEIVPGSYTLDVAYDAGDENRGKVETPLTVDPYQAEQFALSGLALSRQYGPASDPGLHTDAMWTADRTPLISQGMRVVPSGSNRFAKSDAPAVYAEIYEPLLGAPDPKVAPDARVALAVGVRIRVIDLKNGEQKLDTGLLSVTLPATPGGRAIPTAKRVPIESLGPGSYRIEVEASDTAGKSARRTADFEIE